MSVYLFPRTSFFWGGQQIFGGWDCREGNVKEGGVEGKLLNLETIKDVSSALCLVCSHTSAVLGSTQGHDNTHYRHYLPEQPINSRGHDKVPSSEELRPFCSLTVRGRGESLTMEVKKQKGNGWCAK